MENILKYIYNAIKDTIEKETPIVLESITGFTIEKKDKKLLKFINLVKKEYLVFYAFLEMG